MVLLRRTRHILRQVSGVRKTGSTIQSNYLLVVM
jgi:hypothetical protein